MGETVITGRAAAGGIAIGRIRILRASAPLNAGGTRASLEEALAVAADMLRDLQGRVDGEAADIVEFQLEVLGDAALLDAVAARIDAGEGAAAAFTAAAEAELAVYDSAQDELLRARAVDIRDARDRVLRLMAGVEEAAPSLDEGDILVCDDLTPTAFLELDWTRAAGAATVIGSSVSHVAILARGRGVPLVTGVAAEPAFDGCEAVLDGDAGRLVVDPAAETLASYHVQAQARVRSAGRDRRDAAGLVFAQSGRRIKIYLNVDDEAALTVAPRPWFDGIGLARSELMLVRGSGLIGEEAEVACYRLLFDWAGGSPTTIRLLDVGGDKPVPGLSMPAEANPFLGVRGIRLLLRHPDLLRRQLHAIVRAAAGRPARILVPMVTVPDELAACRALLREIDGGADVRLGAMVETPALALSIAEADADFFSIGTNDLTQYVMAAARDEAELAHFHRADHPAVLSLIDRVVAHGRATAREVSVCGDAASDPRLAVQLVAAGVEALSLTVTAAPAVKLAVRRATADAASRAGAPGRDPRDPSAGDRYRPER